MKITLIQIDLVMGSRVLLSVLRDKGYEAKALQINTRYTDLLTSEDMDIIHAYAADSDVVGLHSTRFTPVMRGSWPFICGRRAQDASWPAEITPPPCRMRSSGMQMSSLSMRRR